MPIDIQWLDEHHTIIKHTYSEPWTLSQYMSLIEETYRLIEEAGHTVHIINDMNDLRQLPDNMIPALYEAVKRLHPNEGIKVMVAANNLVRILVESAHTTMGKDISIIHFVDSVEEALKIITSQSNHHTPHETANSNHQ